MTNELPQAAVRRRKFWHVSFSLRILLVAVALVGLSSWLWVSGRPELALATTLPLTEGLIAGDIVPKRTFVDGAALLRATLLVPALMVLFLWIIGTIWAIAHPTPDFWAPAILQGLAGALVLLPGMILYGAPAALIGVFTGHLLRGSVDPA